MPEFSRRDVLKSGLSLSAAGLVGTDALLLAAAPLPADAAVPHTGDEPSPAASAVDAASPRQKLLLDHGWRFHLGNADNAAEDFRWGAPTREGTFSKAGQAWIHNPKDNSLQHSFDDSAWRVVDLPHDWAVELPFVTVPENEVKVNAAHGGKPLGRQFPATSIGWYNRTFSVPASDLGRRLSIEFDGIFRDALVLFNGFYLGRNLSGYAPFSFDVTDYVKYGGPNVITVRVDATLNEGWYYEGAGIYRHTWLTRTHTLHIARWGTAVRSELRGNGASLAIETEVQNESDLATEGTVLSSVFDAAGALVATLPPARFKLPARGTAFVHADGTLRTVRLWSLEDPHLYRVVSHVESQGEVTDRTETTFGVRSVHFDADRGFFLNGKPVKIKGTCNHQDHAGVGIAVPDSIHADRVAALKSMGSNGWRTAHNIVATEFLDACDRQGMMVMAETRMMASTHEGLSELERMVKRDRNHPSIVIWSLANEEYFYQGTPTGARIVSTMKRLVREIDPTRPVTAAMNGGWVHGGISDVVDVQGFNYWNGNLPDTKSNKPEGAAPAYDIDAFHREFPKLPCIGTEVSNVNATRGVYQEDPARGHVAIYKAACSNCLPDAAETWWSAYDQRPFLSGGFTWVGFDYRGEPTPYDRVSISSQAGALDTCGFPKDIYFYYQSWWGTEPVLHLFPHWNWPGREGTMLEVHCFSNLESVELFVNGRSHGAKPVVRNSHLTWSVPYAAGAIEARGSRGGKVLRVDRRETTGAPDRLVLRANRNSLAADRADTSAVTVEVQDAAGRVVPTACNMLQFQLTGPGKLIGVGNGDPSCREADRPDAPAAATRSAFNGLCLALVQATDQPGTILLEVTAADLPSTHIQIEAVVATHPPNLA